MRILLVEDNIQLAENLTKALKDYYDVVDLAKDGEAAWNWVELIKYDLVVLEITLPKLDGIAFCERLRHSNINSPSYQNATVPVLMLAASDTVTDQIAAAFNARANDLLVKPLDLKRFIDRVQKLLVCL